MVVAPKSKQNRVIVSDTHSQLFMQQGNISLIFILRTMALVLFSLNKIVGSLFHSLVTDGINTSPRTVRLYIMRDSINHVNFLFYHFLTYGSERKIYFREKA